MPSFPQTLLSWYRQNGRELPWRATRDPYAIWLSEIILQQTQVRQGWAYWERFMQRWPTVGDLARATEDEVLRQWQGLGYYSRARNLHTAARQIVERGDFPRTLPEIKRLKGVGDYTAAAIGSLAFGLPVAVVDGNVYRVLSRHYGIATPIDTTEGKHEFAALAQELLPPQHAAEYNQAIMDFGATQCTPHAPRCHCCPLQDTCAACHAGTVGQLPVKSGRTKTKELRVVYVYIRCGGYTAIHRRPAGDIWQGLYEPLAQFATSHSLSAASHSQSATSHSLSAASHSQSATSHSQSATGHSLFDGRRVGESDIRLADCRLLRQSVRHVLTHRVIYADFYLLETDHRPPLPDGYFWIPESQLGDYAIPRLVEILLLSLP